jgi:hypothetical protein
MINPEDQVSFNPLTETFTYPNGTQETIAQYQRRKHQFEYIRNLQSALEELKVLYQNPGCMTKPEYCRAKEKIEEEFDFWEVNLFVEYDDEDFGGSPKYPH